MVVGWDNKPEKAVKMLAKCIPAPCGGKELTNKIISFYQHAHFATFIMKYLQQQIIPFLNML